MFRSDVLLEVALPCYLVATLLTLEQFHTSTPVWTFIFLVRLLLWVAEKEHTSYVNVFTPVWVLRWVFEVALLCVRETTTCALEGSTSGVNPDVGRQVASL